MKAFIFWIKPSELAFTDWLDWLIDWLTGLTGWLTDWFTGWLTDWLNVKVGLRHLILHGRMNPSYWPITKSLRMCKDVEVGGRVLFKGIIQNLAERSKALSVFGRRNTGIMGSNTTHMDVVSASFCALLSCVGRGLASGRSHVQGVLPTVQIDS
jgi:hypothetical protein